ncbi:hypothetical protein JRC04_21950 [Mycolicibacterium sp. S2-37]|uniref:hypothetical protein n=1 Tax=Mycolicibacterium sp. S2-37 TaxID=2810297 RepID=UPI001A9495A2|nr:hypothetical protein [Mycolicibacterium sp. S2-37]MBO0680139.1 hypothetical protein [Mycolicibacterium sp. S2-37]
MKTSIAAVFLCVVFGPFGLFCLAWTVIFIARGELLSALVALGFALFTCGLVAMLLVVATRRVTPRVASHDDATLIRPDRRVDALLTAATCGAFLGMACYAVFAPLDMLEIEVASGNQRYFVVVCAAGVVVGVLSLWQIIRRRGTSYLRLSADGLETGNTMTTAKRSWDEVTDIADRPRKGRHSTGATYIMTGDGHVRDVPTDWYTPGGRALRELMRFYWRNPDDRGELSDGRAATRFDSQTGTV